MSIEAKQLNSDQFETAQISNDRVEAHLSKLHSEAYPTTPTEKAIGTTLGLAGGYYASEAIKNWALSDLFKSHDNANKMTHTMQRLFEIEGDYLRYESAASAHNLQLRLMGIDSPQERGKFADTIFHMFRPRTVLEQLSAQNGGQRTIPGLVVLSRFDQGVGLSLVHNESALSYTNATNPLNIFKPEADWAINTIAKTPRQANELRTKAAELGYIISPESPSENYIANLMKRNPVFAENESLYQAARQTYLKNEAEAAKFRLSLGVLKVVALATGGLYGYNYIPSLFRSIYGSDSNKSP